MTYLRYPYPSFHVGLSADQSDITNTTWTQVLVNTVASSPDFDTHSGADTANSKYVIPWGYTGKWIFTGVVWLKTGANALYVRFYKNGAATGREQVNFNIATVRHTESHQQILAVSEGDEITLYMYHSKGDNTPDIDAAGTCFAGRYLGE